MELQQDRPRLPNFFSHVRRRFRPRCWTRVHATAARLAAHAAIGMWRHLRAPLSRCFFSWSTFTLQRLQRLAEGVHPFPLTNPPNPLNTVVQPPPLTGPLTYFDDMGDELPDGVAPVTPPTSDSDCGSACPDDPWAEAYEAEQELWWSD